MFTKMTGIPTSAIYLRNSSTRLCLSGVAVEFGDPDDIGARAQTNFSDEYLETFPSKHC